MKRLGLNMATFAFGSIPVLIVCIVALANLRRLSTLGEGMKGHCKTYLNSRLYVEVEILASIAGIVILSAMIIDPIINTVVDHKLMKMVRYGANQVSQSIRSWHGRLSRRSVALGKENNEENNSTTVNNENDEHVKNSDEESKPNEPSTVTIKDVENESEDSGNASDSAKSDSKSSNSFEMATASGRSSIGSLYRELQVWSRRAFIVNIIGFVVSIYGLYVEIRHEADPKYQASCDISSYISCTRALSHDIGRGFGIVKHILGPDSILNQRNPLFGVFGYSTLAALQLSNSPLLIRLCVIVAITLNAVSAYLTYNLIQMQVICLVCYAIHICNMLFFYFADKRRTIINQIEYENSKKKAL
ncbi:hypothetical protein WR25_15478 [Diploscapter pachys]|uniref:vitamin-K-epoxide reductase (warfarin-sensitive) n=1 Tax=Diploscapter pachys TaxID=2018661 RepID=A0A2A2J3L4_9BILA|nr:hypothetical protein WR25_15478 [Diploscapter pachys]